MHIAYTYLQYFTSIPVVDSVPVPTVPKQTNFRIDIVCKSKISPYKNDIWES